MKPASLPARTHLWLEEDAFAFNLLCLFLDTYGLEAADWMPETIWLEVSDDFGGIAPSNFHKLLAALFVLTDTAFFSSAADFNRTVLSLSSDPQGHIATALQCAWGITEGLLISPPEKDQQDVFSEDIRALVGQVCDQEGLANPPDVLRIGLHDRKHWENITYDWSDDPEMFSGIQGYQAQKSSEIDRTIKNRLRVLLAQLGSLHLQHGQATQLVQKLLAKLPDPDKDLPLPSEI